MPSSPPISQPVEEFDLLDKSAVEVEEPWVEDGDPLPLGWEDWIETEGELCEDREDLNWTDLEWSRPSTMIGYKTRATLPDLGGLMLDAYCDTGKPWSRLFAPRKILAAVDAEDVEGEPALMLRVLLGGREARLLIRLEEHSEAPVLVVGRDLLRLGWIVDVRECQEGPEGAKIDT